MTITVSPITADQHLAFIAERSSASFLQTPAWGQVKPEWRSESIGWFEGDDLIGVGLVLFRQLPKLKRFLAYLPEGPVLDWERPDIQEQLDALVAYARKAKAFAVRIGPAVTHRVWGPDAVKAAVADEEITTLSQADPDIINLPAVRWLRQLEHLGWKDATEEEGFSAGQPKFNFQLPLRDQDGAPKTEAQLLKGMNQQWRRNIKRAARMGVEVREGTREELARFHEIYLETAERDGFTGRALAYFETMWDALNAEKEGRMRLYLAEHEGDLVAATTMVVVGEHSWYSYGASTTAKRDVRGSNAIQWQMIRDSLAAGCAVYDMRGITEGVSSDDPEIGLIRFKVGTGGDAVAYLGEWDMPINPVLYAAFDLYMKRR